MRRTTTLTVTVLLALAMPAVRAAASVPTIIHYQGVLTNSVGDPVTTATSVVFTVYDSPNLPTVVKWTEARTVTPDSEGRFAILLGQATPFHDSVFKSTPLFLGVKVGSDDELTPRSVIATVPYAYRPATVDGATGGTITGDVEVLSNGSGSGLGVRDPGGNVGGYTPTSSVFSDPSGDTIAQFGNIGVRFIEPSTGDTIFEYDPSLSSIRIGLDNTTTGSQSGAIGTGNTVSANNSFAIGTGNTVDSNNSFALGTDNISAGRNAFVSGSDNLASGRNSAVLAGINNQATGIFSTVGGGFGNRATNGQAGVLAGFLNTASGENAIVGGGNSNVASGDISTVAGGAADSAGGLWSTVGGGWGNKSMATGSTTPGGYANRATGDWSFAAGRVARALHWGAFVWADADFLGELPPFPSTAANEFAVRATGGVRFITTIDGTGTPTAGVTLASGGGAWGSVSDRNVKENVEPVSGEELLAKLSQIPIAEWNYISQNDSIRHIGPMAQDFYAAFGVGEDDKHITTIDADGVALAAIQALYKRNLELEGQIVQLRRMIEKR